MPLSKPWQIAALAALGAVFVVAPVVDYVRAELFLRRLPATFSRNPRFLRQVHSPLTKALRVPAHAVWYALRYGVIAPALVALQLCGFSQDDVCLRLLSRGLDGTHAKNVAVFAADVAAAKAVCATRPLLVVSTFAKSGTNLTLFLAACILTKGDGVAHLGGDHVHAHMPWPDGRSVGIGGIELRDAVLQPRRPCVVNDTIVVKTHLPVDQIPFHDTDKYIVVLRDPKDIALSLYHFSKAVALGPAMFPLSTVARMFAQDDVADRNDHWAAHADAAWRLRAKPNVLVLFYEEMVANPTKTAVDVAQFMGVELTAAELARVVEQTSFKFMQQIGLHFDGGVGTPLSTGGEMIRSGKVGEAKSAFTQQQRDAIDAAMLARLQALNSTFSFVERYGHVCV
jgi:hypothetical protein